MRLKFADALSDSRDMGYDVERRPGEWVAHEATRRERAFWVVALPALAASALSIVLVITQRLSAAPALILIVVVLGLGYLADVRGEEMILWFKGARAEEAVGATLNELRRAGWIVMHDIAQSGEGNIDHVVWHRERGVYLVETKFRRFEDRHLAKVKRQAAKLHDALGCWVTPVICLSERDREPFKMRGVWVVPRGHLVEWLSEQRNRSIDFDRLALWAETVDG